jgi:asparagine synthase (glutamine-hydrolysing)
LARDRTGIKPLYFAHLADRFVFASELKSILKFPGIPRKLNYSALGDYFALGYPVLPQTFFEGIHEARPGHSLHFKNGQLRETPTWNWQRTPEAITFEEALEQTETALVDSIERHLVADVPVGAFLSGGIDSTLIAALCKKRLGVNLRTFTISFNDSQYDESQVAIATARKLDLDHKVIPLSYSEKDFATIEKILLQFDQPFVDSSAIPTYFVCEEIRKHVKVALSGDGGDEMFGGYPRFRYADYANSLAALPRPILSLGVLACKAASWVCPVRARHANRLLNASLQRGESRLLGLVAYDSPLAHERLKKRERLLGSAGEISESSDGDSLGDSTIRFALPGDYLRKIDVMSSAHGLEVRVPFLGNEVLDLSSRLPKSVKYRGTTGKLLLRSLVKKYVADETGSRTKSGFGVPLDSYLSPVAKRTICELLSEAGACVRPFVDTKCWKELSSAFLTGRWDKSRYSRFMVYQNVYMLWSLETWLRKWNPTI